MTFDKAFKGLAWDVAFTQKPDVVKVFGMRNRKKGASGAK
jgi:hypothetical protein